METAQTYISETLRIKHQIIEHLMQNTDEGLDDLILRLLIKAAPD